MEGSREQAVPRSLSMQSHIKEDTSATLRGRTMMGTKLARISQLSAGNPNMAFTSVGHLIDKEMLKQCHMQMDGDKAVGIDGVTKEAYHKNLDENLDGLVERLKKKKGNPISRCLPSGLRFQRTMAE